MFKISPLLPMFWSARGIRFRPDTEGRAEGHGLPLDNPPRTPCCPTAPPPASPRSFIVAVLGSALPVGAQDGDPLPANPYERLAEVKRRQAEAAMAIDLLNASQVEVQHRLDVVEAWVASQQTVVAKAQAELVDATIQADRARRRARAKAAELDALKERMADLAVEAYMRPPQMAAMDVIVTHDLASAEKADVMLRAKAQRDEQVAEALAEAEKALQRLLDVAESRAQQAESAADSAATALDELHRARDEQLGLAQQIQTHLQDTSLQLLSLGGEEAAATESVQRETAALLARVTHGTTVPLMTVRGIQVHADIAPGLEALLAEAEADGVTLSGWGYRTTDSADLVAPPALRWRRRGRNHGDLPRAAVGVLPSDRQTRDEHARAGPRRGLHQRWRLHLLARRPGVRRGWPSTPPTTGSTTCRVNPGTGRSTASRRQVQPLISSSSRPWVSGNRKANSNTAITGPSSSTVAAPGRPPVRVMRAPPIPNDTAWPPTAATRPHDPA